MRSNKWSLFFLLCLTSGLLSPLRAKQNEALTRFLNSSSLSYASIGLKVVEVESGQTICTHNEQIALSPASTLKVLTTATALELFGSDYRFPTYLAYRGAIDSKGVLKGDLLIIGSGDPSLGSAYLSDENRAFLGEWTAAIKKAGILTIEGDLVVVDNLYGYEGISNRWIWGDIGNYYASGTYGISVFDNSYQLHLQSGAAGTQPTVLRTEPYIPGIRFENHLLAASNSLDSAYIHGIPFSLERRLYGTIPANRSKFTIKGDIPDPGLQLALTFGQYLKDKGVKLTGKSVTDRQATEKDLSNTKILYTHKGHTLEEIIRITNFRSNNHFAEHLFYKTGWDKTEACTEYVPNLAANRTKSFWKEKGIDTEGLFQYDGSGLSNANGITADCLTSVLVYMQKQSKNAEVFYGSMPLTGVEGSVRSFLKGTALAGKARIKSGSISKVHAYAGYLEKGGKKYAFTLLVNNFTGSRSALRTEMERLLLGIL